MIASIPYGRPAMPITCLNAQSETAARHPEEMNATLDLTIGNAVSVKATVRTTPAGLVAAALSAAAVLFPAALDEGAF